MNYLTTFCMASAILCIPHLNGMQEKSSDPTPLITLYDNLNLLPRDIQIMIAKMVIPPFIVKQTIEHSEKDCLHAHPWVSQKKDISNREHNSFIQRLLWRNPDTNKLSTIKSYPSSNSACTPFRVTGPNANGYFVCEDVVQQPTFLNLSKTLAHPITLEQQEYIQCMHPTQPLCATYVKKDTGKTCTIYTHGLDQQSNIEKNKIHQLQGSQDRETNSNPIMAFTNNKLLVLKSGTLHVLNYTRPECVQSLTFHPPIGYTQKISDFHWSPTYPNLILMRIAHKNAPKIGVYSETTNSVVFLDDSITHDSGALCWNEPPNPNQKHIVHDIVCPDGKQQNTQPKCAVDTINLKTIHSLLKKILLYSAACICNQDKQGLLQ